jgi:hypothetical protein
MMKTILAPSLLLALATLVVGTIPVRQLAQNEKQQQDCKKRLIDWKNQEDLGIRIFYSPAGLLAHPPRVFLPMSPLDQRLGVLDREVIGVTPSEMRALLRKLADADLDWIAYNQTIPLFPGFMNLPREGFSRVEFLVSCGKGSCEAYLNPVRFCDVLSTLDSAITTPKGLWYFQTYRVNLGCKIIGYDPQKYHDPTGY